MLIPHRADCLHPFASTAHIERLETEASHFARLAERHAEAMLSVNPRHYASIAESLRFYSNAKERLQQQIAWLQRCCASTYPKQPAWSD